MRHFIRIICAAAAVLGTASLAQPAQDPSSDALSALTQLLAENDDPQFQLDILKGMSEAMKGRRGVQMPTGWEQVATKLGASSSAQVRELAQTLSVTFGSESAFAALRETLMNSKADAGARSNALVSLLQARDPQLATALQTLLDDPAMRAGALRGLAAYDDPGTAAVILNAYAGFTLAEKRDALNTLSSRAVYSKALLAAIADKRIPARDMTADIVRQLRSFKDSEINEQVAKIWGVARESEGDKLKQIARFKTLLAAKGYGDSRRGRAVFARICQQCHVLFGEGGKVGPDLTGSNRADVDYVLQNTIDPNAVIPNDYRTSNIETEDDRSITGIVTKQDEKTLTIVTTVETLVLSRGEVKSTTQTELSMMPEELLQALTEDEVRDLLAYLRSPIQAPLPSERR